MESARSAAPQARRIDAALTAAGAAIIACGVTFLGESMFVAMALFSFENDVS